MSTLRNRLHAPVPAASSIFMNDERGLTALEYGRIAGRIGVVIVTSKTTLGSKPSGTFTSIAAALP
jgi:pilus assembly protein Flp/PilA